jgi:hypothetical protein
MMSVCSVLQSAEAEYQASRARYIRTVLAGVEQRVMESIGRRRGPLMVEIANLALLAHTRYEVYQTALNAYSAKAPNRVTPAGLLPPSPAERMIRGIDKLYKAAVRAAAEFNECDVIVKKRKDQLQMIDQKMRVQVEQYGRDIIGQLETPTGLEGAFMRDPLLGRAYARMLNARARHASICDQPK